MSKLPRVTNKLYGSDIDLEDIGQFGSAQSGSKVNTKDIPTIQSGEAWTKGWTHATMSNNKYPTRQERNGMDYSFSYQIDYLLREGWPEYDEATEYNKHSVVKAVEGDNIVVYESLIDDNIGFPLTNASAWQRVSFGGSGLELCDIGMALYVDESKGLRRYLNGQIVDINANTQAWLNRLLEIKNTNPDYFTDEATWQSEATLNIDGCVYKYVLNYDDDGTNVVSVRLPKYPDYVEIDTLNTSTTPVVGNGIALGMTNGNQTGSFVGNTYTAQMGSPAFGTLGVSVGTNAGRSAFNDKRAIGLVADPTTSGVIADLSSQKQTKLKLRYFTQIATGSETENNIVNDIELNNPYTLFDSKYVEAPLYNLSWLNASDGAFHSGTVYVKAYEALVVEQNSDITAGTTVDLPSGTKYTKRGLSVKLSTDSDITNYDFVLNTENQTFRLPLKNGQEGVFASGVKGNGLTLGLTDGTTNVGLYGTSNTAGNRIFNKSAYGVSVAAASTIGDNAGTVNSIYGVTTNSSKSGMVVDKTVPEGYTLYYYVGETTQNANLIDAGRIGEVLMTKTDAEQAAHASRPSGKYIDLTLGKSGSTYIAPADGWVSFSKVGSSGQYVELFNNTGGGVQNASVIGASGNWGRVSIPVSKGDNFYVGYTATDDTKMFRFVYAQGEA